MLSLSFKISRESRIQGDKGFIREGGENDQTYDSNCSRDDKE